jgi:hypothetical protein
MGMKNLRFHEPCMYNKTMEEVSSFFMFLPSWIKMEKCDY